MTIEEFILVFEDALPDVPVGSIQMSDRFRQLPSWDSLSQLMLTDAIEMEYRVLLKKEDYAKCDDLESLYRMVLSKM